MSPPSSYLLVVTPTCDMVGCTKRVASMVFNAGGDHVGCFCAKHGKQLLAKLHRGETTSRAA